MKLLLQSEAHGLLWLRRFVMSGRGIAAQGLLAALMVVLGAELMGIAVFVAVFCAVAVLSDQLLATAPSFLFTCLFLISTNNTTAFERFLPFVWLAVIPVAALLFHLWRYRVKLVLGRAVWAWLGVSVVMLTGGLGYISAAEYFALASIYHMLALGFGMLIAYVWLSSAVQTTPAEELPRFVANMMAALGLLGGFMVFHHYFVDLLTRMPGDWSLGLLEFQWRNNVSTTLMLALPFAFFKALRQPAWLLAAAAMFAAILLSGSRGGMVFGSVTLLLCIVFVLIADQKRRKFYLCALGLMAVALALAAPRLIPFFGPTLRRMLDSLRYGDEDARLLIWQRGWQDFLRRPVFGTGLGYMGNRDVHPSLPGAMCWYHNSLVQIIGSFGLFGVLAFGYMYAMRFVIFLRRRSAFHITLLLSWLSLEMMSLVNPGVFAPLPYLLIVVMFMVLAERHKQAPLTPDS